MKFIRFISYFFIVCLITFSWLPTFKINAQTYDYDLGFADNNDVWLSEELLIIGDSVRLYAQVHNFGTQDNTGYVTFYQGTTLIGESQVVTVLPDSTDDVWVDFEIPEDDFNILARIMGIFPMDENSNNNEAVTGMYFPEEDGDGDGIPDSQDPDLDNDNLTNDEEEILGTDPENPDTDDDGFPDDIDEYPLDPENNPPIEEEPRDIFAPINFNQNNNENTNVEIAVLQTPENINLNTNLNLNLNTLDLPIGQDIENRKAAKFITLKNLWFDLILLLVILTIILFIYLAYRTRESQKDDLRNEIFSLKEKKPEKNRDTIIANKEDLEDFVPMEKQMTLKKKIKVKKISEKSPRSRKTIGIKLLTDEKKATKKTASRKKTKSKKLASTK